MKIGPGFTEARTLPDGTPIVVRAIRPEDRAGLRDEFHRLSPESRYRRFFAHVHELTDEVLAYLTEVDGIDHVALLAVADTPDLKSERGIGVARFVRMAGEPAVAEAAVIVVDDWHRRGVGRALGETLLEAARERKIRRFRGEVLATNVPMLEVLGSSGARLEDTGMGTFTFEVSTDLEHEPVVLRVFRAAAASFAGLLYNLLPMPPRR